MSTAIDRRVTPDTEEEEAAVDASSETVVPGSRDSQRPLSPDLTFELLMSHRRRLTLTYLDDQPSITLSTLAERVAAQENEKPVHELSSAERKRVYISLYQCHLPKLDDAGVVVFDSARGTVERNALADHFAPFLDRIAGNEDPAGYPTWHYYYLGLALAGGGLLATQLALLPTPAATTAVAGAVIAALASLALVHARHETAST